MPGRIPLFFRNILLAGGDEKIPERLAYVYGGRLRGGGKSKRSKAPADGHRSDSTGIVDQFPSQRSSDSGFVTLRLSRPPELRAAKIFSPPRRCPLYTYANRSGIFSVFWRRNVLRGVV